MNGVSERLRRALELGDQEPKSMRGLFRELRERGRFDGSYSTLHRYFTGETEPPTSFVMEVADVVGVEPTWLLTGRGPRVVIERELGEVVWESFVEGCRQRPGKSPRDFTPPDSLKPLSLMLWRRRHRAHAHPPGHFDSARQVGAALMAPFSALGLDPAGFSEQDLERILLALVPGIAAVSDYIHEPEPQEESNDQEA